MSNRVVRPVGQDGPAFDEVRVTTIDACRPCRHGRGLLGGPVSFGRVGAVTCPVGWAGYRLMFVGGGLVRGRGAGVAASRAGLACARFQVWLLCDPMTACLRVPAQGCGLRGRRSGLRGGRALMSLSPAGPLTTSRAATKPGRGSGGRVGVAGAAAVTAAAMVSVGLVAVASPAAAATVSPAPAAGARRSGTRLPFAVSGTAKLSVTSGRVMRCSPISCSPCRGLRCPRFSDSGYYSSTQERPGRQSRKKGVQPGVP